MAFVLTRPVSAIGASNGVPGVVAQDIIIPPGDTVIVDTTTDMTVKWIYTLIDLTNSKVLTAEALGMNRMGVNPTWNVYGIIGDKLKHITSITMSAGQMEFNITNNELVPLKVNIVRITVTP